MSSAAGRPERPERPNRTRWAGIAFIAVVLLAALVVSRACQEQDVRIEDDQALAAALEAVDFEPEHTSVKFLRRGVRSFPYYAVSLSRGRQGEPDARLATVLVNARSGKVEDVDVNY